VNVGSYADQIRGAIPPAASITNATRTNPVQITTAAAHGFTDGQKIYIRNVSGMTQLNNNIYVVANATTNSFTLRNESNTSDINGTSYYNYNSGGNAWCAQSGCQYFRFTNMSGGLSTFQVSTCTSERVGAEAYTDAAPSTAYVGLNYPASNNPCPSVQIVPLTASKTTLNNEISSLSAGGSTAGQVGIAWGWYMLSPNFGYIWPNAENVPASYTASDTVKVSGIAHGVPVGGELDYLDDGTIAAALKADLCEIYTDVDGVFTTNPNICEHARKINRISYEEMLEMASLGAKVLQTRSVEFAKKYGVTVHVRSSFNEREGTIVCEEEVDMEQVVVSGVTYDTNQARIEIARVPDRPGIAATFFDAISKANIMVDMIIQTSSLEEGLANMAFTISKDDFPTSLKIAQSVAKELGAKEVIAEDEMAKVSMVGVGMRSHSGVASKMFSTLAKEGINIKMISTSEIKISCIIDAKYTELAVRSLHDAFELDKGNG